MGVLEPLMASPGSGRPGACDPTEAPPRRPGDRTRDGGGPGFIPGGPGAVKRGGRWGGGIRTALGRSAGPLRSKDCHQDLVAAAPSLVLVGPPEDPLPPEAAGLVDPDRPGVLLLDLEEDAREPDALEGVAQEEAGGGLPEPLPAAAAP